MPPSILPPGCSRSKPKMHRLPTCCSLFYSPPPFPTRSRLWRLLGAPARPSCRTVHQRYWSQRSAIMAWSLTSANLFRQTESRPTNLPSGLCSWHRDPQPAGRRDSFRIVELVGRRRGQGVRLSRVVLQLLWRGTRTDGFRSGYGGKPTGPNRCCPSRSLTFQYISFVLRGASHGFSKRLGIRKQFVWFRCAGVARA